MRTFSFTLLFLSFLNLFSQDTLVLEPLNTFTVHSAEATGAQVFRVSAGYLYAYDNDSRSLFQIYDYDSIGPSRYQPVWRGSVSLELPPSEGQFARSVNKLHHLVAFYDSPNPDIGSFARYFRRFESSPGVPDPSNPTFEMDEMGDIDITRSYFIDFIHKLNSDALVIEKRPGDIWIKYFNYVDANNPEANVAAKLVGDGLFTPEQEQLIQNIASSALQTNNVTAIRTADANHLILAGGNTVINISLDNPEQPVFEAGTTLDDFDNIRLVGAENLIYVRAADNSGNPTDVVALNANLEVVGTIDDRGGDVYINNEGTGQASQDIINFLSPFSGRMYKYKEVYNASNPPYFIDFPLDASSETLYPDPISEEDEAWILGTAVGFGQLFRQNRFISDYYLIWKDAQTGDFREADGYVLFDVIQQSRSGTSISPKDPNYNNLPYPNPAVNGITIPVDKSVSNLVLTITDVSGKVCLNTDIPDARGNGIHISTQDFVPGTYRYVITSNGQQIRSGSFITKK